MNLRRTFSLLAALGLVCAGAAQAQTAQGAGAQQTPPPSESQPTPSPGGSGQRDTVQGKAGDTERAAGTERQMAGATKPKDKLVGLPVETSSGTTLGSVVDIVRNDAGTPTYAVVAIDNDTTAVPYATAASMVQGGKVVMSQARLDGAPKVKQSEWLDQTTTAWRAESDRYWGNTRTASPDDPNAPKPR